MSALTENDAVFFAHIPKTAGRSVREAIGGWFDTSEMLPTIREIDVEVFSEEIRRACRYVGSHFTYRNFVELQRASARHWHTVTFLREPRRRTLSHLRFVQRGNDLNHPFSERLRTRSLAEAVEADDLRAEFANYQARYLVRALAPEAVEPASAVLVLQDRVEIVGLAECIDASLLLAAYRWAMPPLGPARVVNADPDPGAKAHVSQLLAELSGTLEEMNKLDDELYAAGRDRFLGDFARMCDELGVTRVDPLAPQAEDASGLAPLARAVEANVTARRRVVPGPARGALVLRVRGAASLSLFPPDDARAILLRPAAFSGQPIDVLVDTGGRRISEISIVTAPPYEGARWQPQVSVDGAGCTVQFTDRDGYFLRWECRPQSPQARRFSVISVQLPRIDTTDPYVPALVSLTVSDG